MGGTARGPLRQPRTETEQRNFEFLRTEVEIAHAMLEQALSESVMDGSGTAERCFRRSKRAHSAVVRFLSEPKYALTDKDRVWVQAQMAALERRLVGLDPKPRL